MTNETAPAHPGPLTGLRVLELCDAKGHYVGKLLGDMGADVVKIEPPGGDGARRVGPFMDDRPGLNQSLYFWHYNTSKRGVTLNLDTAEGRALFRRLAAEADLIVESLPPGYLDERGLGYAGLAAGHPSLIMTSVTLFGQTGPWRDFAGSDFTALALGGPMMSCGYDTIPGAPPIRGTGDQGYHTGAHYAAIGALIALYHRDLTGEGQYVDAGLHEAIAGTTEGAFPNWEYFRRPVIRQTGRHAAADRTLPWQYPTADGRYVNLMGALPRDQRSWTLLRQWLIAEGMAEELADEEWQDLWGIRAGGLAGPRAARLMEVIGRFIATKPMEEIYHGGQQRGLAWSAVRAPEDILDDPHWADRGFFQQVEHPELGRTITYPGAPYLFHATPHRISRRAPLLGEHNHAIYCGELGLTTADLVRLGETGII
ncbi:MAG: CoA transferase [Chloroflexi bacterium]|nr:CoA transferase [Chloroflexota bacterium]